MAGCLELVVIKLNDVGALLGKQGGHLDELTRSIRQLDLEVHDAAAGNHTFLNHRTHGHGVDVAAGHNRHHHVRAGGGGELARTQVQVFQRSQRNGAGRLDHQLVLLEHEQNHFVDVTLGDGDQIVQELVDQSEGQVAGVLDCNTFGGGNHMVSRRHTTRGQRVLPCRGALRNRTDYAHFRLECLDGERHAGTQATATERHDHVSDVRHVFEDLQTDGALAADDFVIVERRHVNHAFLVGELSSVGGGFVEHIAVQHHIGAVGLGGIDLQRRGDLRHADGGLRTTLTGRIGHALGMVACGCGDDATGDLLFGERCDLVVRAANLEGTGDLQVFRLQENLMTGHLAQYRRRDNFRMTGSPFETFGGQLQFGCMITLQRLQNILLFHSF